MFIGLSPGPFCPRLLKSISCQHDSPLYSCLLDFKVDEAEWMNFSEFFSLKAYKLSRVEICVANCIPPVNDVSLGSYLIKNDLFSQK